MTEELMKAAAVEEEYHSFSARISRSRFTQQAFACGCIRNTGPTVCSGAPHLQWCRVSRQNVMPRVWIDAYEKNCRSRLRLADRGWTLCAGIEADPGERNRGHAGGKKRGSERRRPGPGRGPIVAAPGENGGEPRPARARLRLDQEAAGRCSRRSD